MNNLKDFTEYITEIKSERKIVQDLARHLAFDKDIIKYLNTSRAKRKIGWRDLLTKKLNGNQMDYINYITKNMVADYNPQITGYLKMNSEDDNDENENTLNNPEHKLSLADIVNDLTDRVEDVEDVLGINPKNAETLDNVVDKLKEVGYEPDWIENEDDETNDNEEE